MNNKTKVEFNHLVAYCPHGVNPKTFFSIDKTESNEENYAKLILFKKELFGDKKYDYVVFYNSRNIHRKHPSDIILAYKHFCDTIGAEAASKTVLLMHTQPQDENGTDLQAVKNALAPNNNIIFSNNRIEPEKMNFLYNIADINVLISSNEGFGISGIEALMAETPIVVNVTGGMQDYCGFHDENLNPIEFDENWSSNHDGRYKIHGQWVYPVFPSNRSLQGSIPTPYIFDDRASIEDIAEGIYYWYLAGKEKRDNAGKAGREFCLTNGFNSDNMNESLIEGFEYTFNNWKPRKKFDLYKIEKQSVISGGFQLKKLDKSKLQDKIEVTL